VREGSRIRGVGGGAVKNFQTFEVYTGGEGNSF